MVLKQIMKDLWREWSWALFYTIVATMTLMAILYLSIGFSTVRKQSSSIKSFVDQKVVMFEIMETQMQPSPAKTGANKHQASDPSKMINFLQKSLSKEGKAGSYFFIGNNGFIDAKYEQILILFGQYSNLTGLEYSSPMALFAPEANKEDVGTKLSVVGKEIQIVETFGSDFSLFHPLSYFDAENPFWSKTLILCTRDLETVNRMFPTWNLSSEVLSRMVLVNPSDAEVDQLQHKFYDQYGKLYKGISTKDFTQTSTDPSMRAYKLFILFYTLSGFLLILLLLLNVIRMIEINIAEYTVHHLYGAPIRIIQRRVGGYVLALNILPIVGVIYVLVVNQMAIWYFLPLVIAFILVLYLFSTSFVSKRIGTLNGLGNLRRDY